MSSPQTPPGATRRGRPLLGHERRRRYQVTLEPKIAEWLRQAGGGNLSGGITTLAARAARAAAITAALKHAARSSRPMSRSPHRPHP